MQGCHCQGTDSKPCESGRLDLKSGQKRLVLCFRAISVVHTWLLLCPALAIASTRDRRDLTKPRQTR